MYTIGCHVKDFRRTTDVLKHSRSEPLDFDFYKQDKDFYIFEFPNSDYEDFKSIVILLKKNGINALGADEQLSERNIMKLTNLLKEQEDQERPNPMESADDIITKLEEILETWETKEYESDEARWNEYYQDIEELVEDYKENQSIDREDPSIEEQKLRKLIQKLITEWRK
tara:strand:+ start:148 stop:657 length:510 start_codon:yes stop_codon:yes gene_type:complete